MLKSGAVYKGGNVYFYFTFIHIDIYLYLDKYCDNIIL